MWKDERKLAAATATAAIRLAKGQKPPTTGLVKTKGRGLEPAYLIAPKIDHEGELEAAAHQRLLQAERDLQRRVQEVLLDDVEHVEEAPLRGASTFRRRVW